MQQIDNDIATLMEACWHQTPSERPTFGNVIDFLQMKIEQQYLWKGTDFKPKYQLHQIQKIQIS